MFFGRGLPILTLAVAMLVFDERCFAVDIEQSRRRRHRSESGSESEQDQTFIVGYMPSTQLKYARKWRQDTLKYKRRRGNVNDIAEVTSNNSPMGFATFFGDGSIKRPSDYGVPPYSPTVPSILQPLFRPGAQGGVQGFGPRRQVDLPPYGESISPILAPLGYTSGPEADPYTLKSPSTTTGERSSSSMGMGGPAGAFPTGTQLSEYQKNNIGSLDPSVFNPGFLP